MTAEKKWKRAKAWRNVLAVLSLLLAAAVVVTGFMAFRPAQAPEEADPTGSTGPRIPENFLATTEAATEATTQPGDDLDADKIVGPGGSDSDGNNGSTPSPAPATPPKKDEPSAGGNETPAGGNETPAGGNETPAGGNETPAGGNETPASGNDAPAGGTDAPAGGNETPAGGNETPADAVEPGSVG